MKVTNNPIAQTYLNNESRKPTTSNVVVNKHTSQLTSVQSLANKNDGFLTINDKLASTSDVDINKVNQVRELIAQGNLTLDLDVLSDAILEMHRK